MMSAPRPKLVWDTNALSYALEDFEHAALSAYMNTRRKTWDNLEQSLRRRIVAEFDSRELFTQCGSNYICEAPKVVFEELKQSEDLKPYIDLLTPKGKREIEKEYKLKGFARTFIPSVWEKNVNPKIRRWIESKARKMRYRLSPQDITVVALAYQDKATLVTADRAMKNFAEKLGINVIYLMPSQNQVAELTTLAPQG